jgi:hypothetical protein
VTRRQFAKLRGVAEKQFTLGKEDGFLTFEKGKVDVEASGEPLKQYHPTGGVARRADTSGSTLSELRAEKLQLEIKLQCLDHDFHNGTLLLANEVGESTM